MQNNHYETNCYCRECQHKRKELEIERVKKNTAQIIKARNLLLEIYKEREPK